MAFYDDDISMEEHLKRSRQDWNDIASYIHRLDAFRRLVTVHPTQYGHEQIQNEELLDLDMLQTGHGGVPSLVPTMQMAKMAHLERMEDGSFVLFDYKNRDAQFGNAAAFSISQDEIQ